MKKQRGLPADDILQYKAERNTHFLWNEIHPDALMRELTPYKEATAEIEIQEPMLDEPPVPPQRGSIGTFSYVRGQEPPGTYHHGYLPFAGGGHRAASGSGTAPGGSGSGQLLQQPAQPPQPPPLLRWLLPHHPAPQGPPDPTAPWVLAARDVTPYDDFKPKILKEVDDFKGDSNNIT